jgi:hypothetical protein
VKGHTIFTEYYLLFGFLIHVALLGLIDWLGYRHFMTYGYHHSLLALVLLNVGIICGMHYLVLPPFQRRRQLRRAARAMRRQRLQP